MLEEHRRISLCALGFPFLAHHVCMPLFYPFAHPPNLMRSGSEYSFVSRRNTLRTLAAIDGLSVRASSRIAIRLSGGETRGSFPIAPASCVSPARARAYPLLVYVMRQPIFPSCQETAAHARKGIAALSAREREQYRRRLPLPAPDLVSFAGAMNIDTRVNLSPTRPRSRSTPSAAVPSSASHYCAALPLRPQTDDRRLSRPHDLELVSSPGTARGATAAYWVRGAAARYLPVPTVTPCVPVVFDPPSDFDRSTSGFLPTFTSPCSGPRRCSSRSPSFALHTRTSCSWESRPSSASSIGSECGGMRALIRCHLTGRPVEEMGLGASKLG
ncbi:hypothetical protein B0H13DRAFT_2370984 [Mycena leptocephala]|nr:hypothetical protein B0H13DRAFT_2370984 [Mycena leptocephala]